jgi:glycosyltransferase involved in cell wall biosynthesis
MGAKRGGILEMIKHEKNGLIFDPDEPYALDAAMLRVIEEPIFWQKCKKIQLSRQDIF